MVPSLFLLPGEIVMMNMSVAAALGRCVATSVAAVALAASTAAQPVTPNATPEATLRSTPETVIWGYITATCRRP
jgi:hypothetical protein